MNSMNSKKIDVFSGTQHRYTLSGILRTVSPLHISDAAAGDATYEPAQGRGRVAYGKGPGRFPLVRTRLQTLLLPQNGAYESQTASEEPEEPAATPRKGPQTLQVPVIPASTWRGLLRRGVAAVVENEFLSRGIKIPYQLYMGLRCGAVDGSLDSGGMSASEFQRARAHLTYSLFGGGPRMGSGSLRMSTSLPILKPFFESGALTGVINPHPALESLIRDSALDVFNFSTAQSLLQYSHVVRVDDFRGKRRDPDAIDKVEDAVSILDKFFQETADAAKARKEPKSDAGADSEAAAPVRGASALNYREDVVIGVPFWFSLSFVGSEAQLGLLLSALEQRLPLGIGARSAHGYGRVDGALYAQRDGKAPLLAASVLDGSVRVMPEMEAAMQAQAEAIGQLDLGDVTSFYVSQGK